MAGGECVLPRKRTSSGGDVRSAKMNENYKRVIVAGMVNARGKQNLWAVVEFARALTFRRAADFCDFPPLPPTYSNNRTNSLQLVDDVPRVCWPIFSEICSYTEKRMVGHDRVRAFTADRVTVRGKASRTKNRDRRRRARARRHSPRRGPSSAAITRIR